MTAAFVASQPRHLMMWAVFAPRLVFEVAAGAVVGCCCVLGFVSWGWYVAANAYTSQLFAEAAARVQHDGAF